MKLRYLTLALALAGSLTACDQQPSITNDNKAAEAPAIATDDSEVLATVNGTPITAYMLTIHQQQRQNRMPGNPSSQNREAMLDEIINLELALQDGEKKGVSKNPEVQAQIRQLRRTAIASAALQQHMQEHPITDEELKTLYDEKVQTSNEYKARHILVEDKEKAESLIAELDKGADFSELAIEHSTGPSGKSGGDLGWFSPKSMVKPFSDALGSMEKGNYTHEPVKTQFGWHIILLEDTRESSSPPFEQVKPRLEMMARGQRLQNYLQELRAKADIQIMESTVAPATAEDQETPAEAPAADTGDTSDSSETAAADSTESEDEPATEGTATDDVATKKDEPTTGDTANP